MPMGGRWKIAMSRSADMSDDYYPSWLAPGMLADDFPWQAGVRTTLPTFLAEYTLHDSSWIALATDPAYAGSATAVIRFDAFWTEGRVQFPGSVVAEWPILLLHLERLVSLAFAGLDEDIGGISRTIAAADSREVNGTALHETIVEDVHGGRVTLRHAPAVTLLLLDRERQVVPLPLGGAT